MDNPTLEQVLPKQEDIQLVDINLIKPHPKNYKKHPQDQLEHICKSIRENGIYRNILIANDNIILAGHGVYEACKRMGFTKVPTLKINLNSSDPKAMKLLVSDNEIGHLAEIDQISLSETLKSIMDNNTLLAQHWFQQQKRVIDVASSAYKWALDQGIAKEQARAVLPEGNTMSTLYVNGTLRSWIHYIELRKDAGTQKEHRVVAEKCLEQIVRIVPLLQDN